MVAAALFGFIISFGNLEMTLFLVAPGQTTLPIAILQYLQWRIDPTIAAVSLLQIVLIGAGDADHRPLRQADAGSVGPMARLELTALTKTYGDVRAVAGVDLDIAQGELVVLLGPSGCGKTTTLRMIAGFVAPTAGAIRLGGTRHHARSRRGSATPGLVFQSYALFPHLTVAENVAFGLRDAQVAASPKSPRRVAEVLRLVRLEGLCGAPAARIVRRPAAARGARARAGDRARHPAARRAAVQSRRQAAAGSARRDPRAAEEARA